MPKRPPVHRPHGYKSQEQRRLENDQERGSSTQRGYDYDWQKLRKMFLQENPLCWWHQQRGEVVAATVVDHIEPISKRPDLRLTWDNLRAGCKPCHDAHTAKTQGFARPKG